MFFAIQTIANFYHFGQEIKHKKTIKIPLYKNIDKIILRAKITIIKTKVQHMKTTGIFLPFWNLMAWIFVYYLFLEGLKKLGLVKTK